MELLQSKKFYTLTTISFYALGFIFCYLLFFSMGSVSSSEQFYSLEPSIGSVWSIFLNNLTVSIMMISGLFTFGIPTIFVLLINGFWLGGTVSSLLLEGNSFISIAWTLIPHGIFEVPGFLLSGYIGMNGLRFYLAPKEICKLSLKPFFVCILLLGIGAVIEGLYTLGINNS